MSKNPIKAHDEKDNQPKETHEMPVVPYRVLHADLPLFSDPECQNLVPGARIVVLEALDPDDQFPEFDVVPTQKSYQTGQIVTWELNNKSMWEAGWYQNPETGQTERAWTMSVEFIGRLISSRTLEANEKRLAELNHRMAQMEKSRTEQKENSQTRVN